MMLMIIPSTKKQLNQQRQSIVKTTRIEMIELINDCNDDHIDDYYKFQSRQQTETSHTCTVLGKANGASASIVTTQGEIVVAKFLAVNGPRGMYSHFCISRAVDKNANHSELIADIKGLPSVSRNDYTKLLSICFTFFLLLQK